jgi:hypothetical protein
MAKNKEIIPKTVKIIIDSLRQNKDVWHFKIEIEKNNNEETICPKDLFNSALINYTTLINVLRLLSKSTEPVRKHVEDTIKKIKEAESNPPQEVKISQPLSRNQRRKLHKKKNTLKQSQNQITFLSIASEALKKNVSSEGMLEKIALVLALTEIVTYEKIENIIKKNGKYEIELPITKYPDLSAMQTQHSSQLLSIVDSLFNIGSTIAKSATGD